MAKCIKLCEDSKILNIVSKFLRANIHETRAIIPESIMTIQTFIEHFGTKPGMSWSLLCWAYKRSMIKPNYREPILSVYNVNLAILVRKKKGEEK